MIRKENKAFESICFQKVWLTGDLQEKAMSCPEQIGRGRQTEIEVTRHAGYEWLGPAMLVNDLVRAREFLIDLPMRSL